MNVNVAAPDAHKLAGEALVGHARATLEAPGEALAGYRVDDDYKLVIVLVQNHGYASIAGLSASLGSAEFGARYRYRSESGQLDGPALPVDLASNAESLGARVFRAEALERAKDIEGTTVVHIETDPSVAVPGADVWWDVPVAEVSVAESVRQARAGYDKASQEVRRHISQAGGGVDLGFPMSG